MTQSRIAITAKLTTMKSSMKEKQGQIWGGVYVDGEVIVRYEALRLPVPPGIMVAFIYEIHRETDFGKGTRPLEESYRGREISDSGRLPFA